MIKIASIFGLSGLLNWASQLKVSDFTSGCGSSEITDRLCTSVLTQEAGFPFAYLKRDAGGSSGSFELASFTGNWVFWLIVAAILIIVFSKVLELFGKAALAVGIIAAIAVYFGVLSL